MANADEDPGLPIPPEDGSGDGVLATLVSWATGIPRVFRKPLAKAAGRLLLGLVEVPAAWLGAKAADIQSRQAIRDRVRSALAKEAIGKIRGNVALADRAVEYFLADILGKQTNREAVLRHAVDELSEATGDDAAREVQPEKDADSLDDDWLNAFARFAENASSDRLRALFGRILAGEIRRAGSYSLFTLDFLSKMGQYEAALITRVAPYVLGEYVILTQHTRELLRLNYRRSLAQQDFYRPPPSAP